MDPLVAIKAGSGCREYPELAEGDAYLRLADRRVRDRESFASRRTVGLAAAKELLVSRSMRPEIHADQGSKERKSGEAKKQPREQFTD